MQSITSLCSYTKWWIFLAQLPAVKSPGCLTCCHLELPLREASCGSSNVINVIRRYPTMQLWNVKIISTETATLNMNVDSMKVQMGTAEIWEAIVQWLMPHNWHIDSSLCCYRVDLFGFVRKPEVTFHFSLPHSVLFCGPQALSWICHLLLPGGRQGTCLRCK